MGTYARAPVEFVRGEGTGSGTPTATSTSTSSPASPWPSSATATRRWSRRSASRRRASMHVATSSTPSRRCGWPRGCPSSRWAARSFFVQLRAPRPTSARSSWPASAPAAARAEIVVLEGGFHGRTIRRPVGHAAGDQAGAVRAARARLRGGAARRSRRARAAVDERTAAVMIEPIQGEAGSTRSPDELLLAAREACDATGALLIFDEIQCGMGRTGHALGLAAARRSRPDVMTVAKALGRRAADRRLRHLAAIRGRAPARRPRLHLRRRPGAGGGRARGARRGGRGRTSSPRSGPRASACALGLRGLSGLDVRGSG